MQQGKCLIQVFHLAAVKWGSNTFYSMITMINAIGYSDVLHILLKVTKKIQQMFVEGRGPHSWHMLLLLLPVYENHLYISVDFLQVTMNVFQIKVRNQSSILCWNKTRGQNQLLPAKNRQHLSFITTQFWKLQQMLLWGNESTGKRHSGPEYPKSHPLPIGYRNQCLEVRVSVEDTLKICGSMLLSW